MKVLANKSETLFDKFTLVYTGEMPYDDLTDKEKAILKRWETVDKMTLDMGVKREDIIPRLRKSFPEISVATAYRDRQDATRFFGDVDETRKKALRRILTEKWFEISRVAFSKTNPDLKAAAAALANIAKYHGLDKDDTNVPDFSKLKQHQYSIGLPPEAIEFLVTFMSKSGVINMNELTEKLKLPEYNFNEDIEDAEIL